MAAVAPMWPFPSAPLAPSTAPTPSSPLPLPVPGPWTPPPHPSGAPSSSTSGTPPFPPVQGVPYSPVALHDQARPLLLQDSEVDAFQRHYLARLSSSPSTRSDPIPLATSATCSSPADHQSTPTSACAAVTNQAEGPGFPTTGNRMHQDRVPAGLNDLAQQLKLAHRSLLNINRQLDEYAQSQRSSVVSLQRKLSQLADRLATPRVSSSALSTTTAPTPSVDFAPSPGSKTVAASAPSIFSAEASSAASSVSFRFGASGSTYAAPQVFAEMPRPNFGHGTPVIAPRYENYGSGYSNQIPSSYVQGGSTNLSEQNPDAMPVYDLYEEDAITSQSYVHPTVDITEAVNEELEVKVYGFKPIICPEKPTDGVYSSANENKYENELHTVCFNNASDSEEATYLKFSHAPVVHSDGFIKLTTENSTQATSTLCVHEAIVYCHDERPEHINCTNGLEPVQLKFEQEDILIGGAVSNIVYSTAWELVAPPSHSINHAKLRLLWDPGTSASLHSSKGNLCNQVDTYGISTDFGFTISEDTVAIDCYSRPTNTCFSAVTRVHLLLHYSKGNRVGNRETLPWYPVIRTPSSIYFCLRGLIATSVIGKQLSWLQISEPATWQSQVTSASYAWDPGVKIFLYSWLNILTVWSETDNSLSCTHIPDLAAWRNQSLGMGSGTCYIWDIDTMDLLDQLELLHQQGIQKNYKARNLLTAPNYLQIVEMNILFITFLPP